MNNFKDLYHTQNVDNMFDNQTIKQKLVVSIQNVGA